MLNVVKFVKKLGDLYPSNLTEIFGTEDVRLYGSIKWSRMAAVWRYYRVLIRRGDDAHTNNVNEFANWLFFQDPNQGKDPKRPVSELKLANTVMLVREDEFEEVRSMSTQMFEKVLEMHAEWTAIKNKGAFAMPSKKEKNTTRLRGAQNLHAQSSGCSPADEPAVAAKRKDRFVLCSLLHLVIFLLF